jgi:polyferredoxin
MNGKPSVAGDKNSRDERGLGKAPRPRRGAATKKSDIPPMLPRYLVQGGFLLFYIWIAVGFVRWSDALRAGRVPDVTRPPAIDGFLPISGLMGLRHWFESGELFPVHPAAALILLAALLSGALLKRGFCSWICPVFPLSEGFWR